MFLLLAMAITSQASPLSLGIRPKAVVLILADDLVSKVQ
jgi:hypothetical protein